MWVEVFLPARDGAQFSSGRDCSALIDTGAATTVATYDCLNGLGYHCRNPRSTVRGVFGNDVEACRYSRVAVDLRTTDSSWHTLEIGITGVDSATIGCHQLILGMDALARFEMSYKPGETWKVAIHGQ